MKTFKEFNEAKRKTIAVFPGSFRPPHKGHFFSVEQYSKKADEVIVILSKPGKGSQRTTNTGTSISGKQAKEVFELYANVYGLNNVTVIESPSPSPIKAAYDYVETLKDVDVIFGSSDDPADLKRWKTVTAYMDKHNPSVTVIDPKTTTVKRLTSATGIRNQIDNIDIYKEYMPKKLKDKDIQKVFNILNK